MDFLPDFETFSLWLTHYGSFALFGLLMLGIVALPVPEETLMMLAGALIRNGQLHLHDTLIAAYLGSMVGITVSYILGRTVGFYFLHRYGGWLGLTEAKLMKAHNWFEKYGKWTLFIGYFIPGVRHFTGFSAGAAKLEYPTFALFAYTGALFWVTTFVSLGYFFGTYWADIAHKIDIDTQLVVIAIIAFVASLIIWRLLKKR